MGVTGFSSDGGVFNTGCTTLARLLACLLPYCHAAGRSKERFSSIGVAGSSPACTRGLSDAIGGEVAASERIPLLNDLPVDRARAFSTLLVRSVVNRSTANPRRSCVGGELCFRFFSVGGAGLDMACSTGSQQCDTQRWVRLFVKLACQDLQLSTSHEQRCRPVNGMRVGL